MFQLAVDFYFCLLIEVRFWFKNIW